MSARRFSVSGLSTEPPWTLRFQSPEAVQTPFVSRLSLWGLQVRLLNQDYPEGSWKRRPPRRPTPCHPEASVDLETSLRQGKESIAQGGRGWTTRQASLSEIFLALWICGEDSFVGRGITGSGKHALVVRRAPPSAAAHHEGVRATTPAAAAL